MWSRYEYDLTSTLPSSGKQPRFKCQSKCFQFSSCPVVAACYAWPPLSGWRTIRGLRVTVFPASEARRNAETAIFRRLARLPAQRPPRRTAGPERRFAVSRDPFPIPPWQLVDTTTLLIRGRGDFTHDVRYAGNGIHDVIHGLPCASTSTEPVSTRETESSIRALISFAALALRLARLRTSPATTANPRPCSPARAASTAAFSADIGLEGNAVDHADDVSDFLRAVGNFMHGFHHPIHHPTATLRRFDALSAS